MPMTIPPNGWRILAQSAVAVSAPADTNENVLATITIPAGAMGPNGRLRITYTGSATSSANNKTTRVRLGGIGGTIVHSTVGTTQTTNSQTLYTANRNSQASQYTANTASVALGTALGPQTSTVDFSVAQDIVITGQKASAGETLAVESYMVELAYGA